MKPGESSERKAHKTASDVLQVEPLLESARSMAKLADFVDYSFIEPMTHLLKSLRSEARLSESGVESMRAHFVDMLVTRLRVQHAVKQNPEILKEEIKGPLVIVGFPRSGTTKLQRLLALNPGIQKLPYWKLLNPAPLGPLKPGVKDPRIALAEQNIKGLKEAFPRFYAGHPMNATEADEEDFLMELSFKSSPSYYMARIPSYQSWVRKQSIASSYRWLRMNLQLTQWYDPPSVRRHPWLLKGPSHLGRLDDLFAVFPGTTVIHCHREVNDVIPSGAAITEALRCFHSDDIDRKEVGQFELDILTEEIGIYLEARKRWTAKGAAFIDVQFQDIVKHSVVTVERISRQVGLPFYAEMRAGIERWEADNPQHKHGRFDYSLDDYGLSPEEIQKRFKEYSSRYLTVR